MKRSFLLLYVLLVHAFYGVWCSVGGSLHCECSNLASLHRPHSVSITEFGAVGDGVTLNTKAFQNALFYLNSFSDKGGAKLFVPAGQWLTGSFDLISHLTLWLDKGATILGSTISENWPVVDPLPSYGRGRELPGRRHRSLIYGQNLTDVVITGENGTIDGQGSIWWDWFRNGELNYTRPHLVELMNSTGLIISNLTFLNSPFWNIHPVYCRDVVVKNLTILAPLESPNTDGVDPDSSTNVCIEDCYIVTGDDLVSIKSGWDEYGISYARPSSKIKINRLTGQTTSSSGISVGSEMSGGVSEVYIKDLHLFNSNTGIRIKTSPGRGGYVRNVHILNVKLDNVKKAIRFTGKYGEHPDEKFDPKALPAIEKITFENVNGGGIGVAGLLEGIEGDEFRNICFLNVTLTVKKKSKKSPWECSNVRGYSEWVSPDITCESLKESIFPEHQSDCFGLSGNNMEISSGLSSRRSPRLLSWLNDQQFMELVFENGQILAKSQRSNVSLQHLRTTSIMDLYEAEYNEDFMKRIIKDIEDTQVVPQNYVVVAPPEANILESNKQHVDDSTLIETLKAPSSSKIDYDNRKKIAFLPPDEQSVVAERTVESVFDTEGFSEGSTTCQSSSLDDGRPRVPARARKALVKRKRNAEAYNSPERKQRNDINKKMSTLQDLLPNYHKDDNESMLDEAINYMSKLQHQVQMMTMGNRFVTPSMMFPLGPYYSQMGMGMQMGAPQFLPAPVLGADLPRINNSANMVRFLNHPGLMPMQSSAPSPQYVPPSCATFPNQIPSFRFFTNSDGATPYTRNQETVSDEGNLSGKKSGNP